MPLCQDSWSRPMTSIDCTGFSLWEEIYPSLLLLILLAHRNIPWEDLPFSFVADFDWPIRIYPEWFAVGRSRLHVLERWYWSLSEKVFWGYIFSPPKFLRWCSRVFFPGNLLWERCSNWLSSVFSTGRVDYGHRARIRRSFSLLRQGWHDNIADSSRLSVSRGSLALVRSYGWCATILLTLLNFPWVERVGYDDIADFSRLSVSRVGLVFTRFITTLIWFEGSISPYSV